MEIWHLLKGISLKGTSSMSKAFSWGENGELGSIGCFVNIWGDHPHVRFQYTQTDESTGGRNSFDHRVGLIKTMCHFGGERFWFECSLYKNGNYCGRRVGVLYKDGDWFGCRHCHELTYNSRNINRKSPMHYLFNTLEIGLRIEKLASKTKRRTWRGVPTRKQKTLNTLNRQASRSFIAYEAKHEKGKTINEGN